MKLRECDLESGKCGSTGLENREHFGGGFHFPFPTINRLDSGNEIHTRSQLPFDKECANLSRLSCAWEGAKDQ